ncbi:thioesterase [Myxococcota bacterium]|nr:thioesterase [Myxococcota bacterium]MBU1497700.1 thioesterase [Myxococcota bacterium]
MIMELLNLNNGDAFTENFEVTEKYTALSLGTGTVPVLSTAALVIAVENFSMIKVQSNLPEGYTSVGTRFEITHLYPSPIGAVIKIEIKIIRLEENRVDFHFIASEGDKAIATGTHRRAFVNTESFLSKIS